MALEDHLKPSEEVQYSSDSSVKYGDNDYNIYLTNDRFILHANRGLVRSKDDIVTYNLGNILKTDYKEEGTIRKKGILRLETEDDQVIELKSSASDMKPVYQNAMQFIE